jgi:hypothetical protein
MEGGKYVRKKGGMEGREVCKEGSKGGREGSM